MRRIVRVVVIADAVASLAQITSGMDVETVGARLEAVDCAINDTIVLYLCEPHHTANRTFGEAHWVAQHSHS